MKTKIVYLLIATSCFLAASCTKEKVSPAHELDETYNPILLLANFTNSGALTNIYFPNQAGKKIHLRRSN